MCFFKKSGSATGHTPRTERFAHFRDEQASTELQLKQKVRSYQQTAWPQREQQKAFFCRSATRKGPCELTETKQGCMYLCSSTQGENWDRLAGHSQAERDLGALIKGRLKTSHCVPRWPKRPKAPWPVSATGPRQRLSPCTGH